MMDRNHTDTYRQTWGFAEDECVLCERCQGASAEIHHITYRSHGGLDEFDNLIALCRRCHDWSHGNSDNGAILRKLKRWPLRLGRPHDLPDADTDL